MERMPPSKQSGSPPPRLNEEQKRVAEHFTGRALVIAGPGSGKTSTITARVGQLLLRQVGPASILCVTFTNKAATEMRERIARRYTVGKKIKICTFHALAGELLRRHGKGIGYSPRMTILDSTEQEELLAQCARQLFASHAEVDFSKPRLRKILYAINASRENLESMEVLEKKVYEEEMAEEELTLMKEYLRRMQASDCTDFSGLLSETVRLLKTPQPEVPEEERLLTKLHRQWRFIQVDEYQDTNVAQNEIVELLAGPADNVMAVGDQDQSIYEWRGANPEGIAKFINRGRGKHGTATYHLSTNYRSTPEIIALADRLIKHSPNRVPIEFVAAAPSIGKPPKLEAFPSPEEEATAVAEKVKACITLLRVPPQEIAVFYRLNDMSRPIETALARLEIPYKVVAGLSFYDRAEIRDCLSMLRLLSNPRDGAAFSRVVNKPKRGIGEKTIGLIENYAAMKEIDLVAACASAHEIFTDDRTVDAVRQMHFIYGLEKEGKSVADLLAEAVQRTNYHQHLESHEKESAEKIEERKRNVDELVRSIALWCEDHETKGREGKKDGGVGAAAIADYLGYIALLTSEDDSRTDDAVRLMSLHASKGLEFDVVFMVGAENGLLPHKKALTERPEAGFNEERRLCYVGFTRARKQLFVSFCRQRAGAFVRGGGKAGGGGGGGGKGGVKMEQARPSPFLLEAGLMTEMEYLKPAAAALVS
jgi:DNA helicase-2/ATP-dependent DNA helicase PcrA